MTLRQNFYLFEKERFSEILKRYGAGEDKDLGYRASRHGALVKPLDSKLCHLWISGGRLSPYQVEVLSALNSGVLQQMSSPDRGLVYHRWKRVLWHRLAIAFIKDLQKRDFSFPRTRGMIYALKYIKIAYKMPLDDIGNWYQCLQSDIIGST